MTRIEAYKKALVAELAMQPAMAKNIVSFLNHNTEEGTHLQVMAQAIYNEVEEKFTEPLTR